MTAIPALTLRELQRAELREAAQLLGRGMRDNPANVRAFGVSDTERRCRALTRFFVPVLRGLYRRDPTEPHWHLGPVAVDSHLQGQGSDNVRFYQRFGFTVVAEGEELSLALELSTKPCGPNGDARRRVSAFNAQHRCDRAA
jgi:hypothetical protein